jgi:hydroxymethylpyrimidine pyrophosphatase-like HAD family hydrolase
MVMRNNVYARFCHSDYHKGTALGEIARRLSIGVNHIFAAGDHLNDLPMLERRHAGCLMAPGNALEAVKSAVRRQGGYVSKLPHGHGVLDGLKHYIASGSKEASLI